MSKTFQFDKQTTTLEHLLGGTNVVKAIKLPIEQLHKWENQPFKPYTINQLNDLVNSIQHNGLLHYPVVLKRTEDYYRILSGHNRIEACRLLGWDTVPCIIKEDISDEQAESIVLASNLQQRHVLSHKEKILAYHRSYALHKQLRLGTKMDYQDDLRTVQRYAQMGHLIPELIDMVDTHQLSLGVAYELSFLTKDKQDIVLTYLLNYEAKLTVKQARELRQLHDTLTAQILYDVVYDTTEQTNYALIAKTMRAISDKELPIVIDLHDLHLLIEYLVLQKIIK